jgi:AcrR family transcriptional regulator
VEFRAVEHTPSASGRGRRGRPPISANRVAVLDATRVVLAAEGYDRMTLEAVANEAGLYRRYINRTWRSKAELVRDALFEDVVAFTVPDTGGLASDLQLLISQHVDLTLRPEFLRGLPGLQAEFRLDADLWHDTMERHVQPPIDAFAEVLSRAAVRGEIGSHADPEIVLNTISGTVQQLALLGLLGRDGLVDHAVRLVLSGMVE